MKSALIVNISNVTEQGVSAGYFLAMYQQGSQVFSALFPCIYALGTRTQSQIFIMPNTTVSSNGNATVKVAVINAVPTAPVIVNVSLMLPPAFTYFGAKSYLLDVNSSVPRIVTFNLYFNPSGQSAYTVAATASYSENGISHATLSTFVLSTPAPATGTFALLLEITAVIAVLAVLALIAVSVFRKGRKSAPAQPQL